MIKNKKVLALIPARGGSKGIIGKNIKKIAGKPLIAWTISAAGKSKYIDRIIVSTDSVETARVAGKYKAEIPFMRPKKISGDKATADQAVVHALDWLKRKENEEYDILIYLQPTSPLRTGKHIDEALEKFISQKGVKALISVKEADDNPYWIKTLNRAGYLSNFIDSSLNTSRRQGLPTVYIPQGALYINWTRDFKAGKSFYAKSKTIPYLMSKEESIDIDDMFDFVIAEFLLKKSAKSVIYGRKL